MLTWNCMPYCVWKSEFHGNKASQFWFEFWMERNLDDGNDMKNIMKDDEQRKINPRQLCKDDWHGDYEFKTLWLVILTHMMKLCVHVVQSLVKAKSKVRNQINPRLYKLFKSMFFNYFDKWKYNN